MVITVETIQACEELTVQLFDHDDGSADDLVGEIVFTAQQMRTLLRDGHGAGRKAHVLEHENKPVIGHDKMSTLVTLVLKPEILIDKSVHSPQRER